MSVRHGRDSIHDHLWSFGSAGEWSEPNLIPHKCARGEDDKEVCNH